MPEDVKKSTLSHAEWVDLKEDDWHPANIGDEVLDASERVGEIGTLIQDCLRGSDTGIRGSERRRTALAELGEKLGTMLEVLKISIDGDDPLAVIAYRNRVRREKLE